MSGSSVFDLSIVATTRNDNHGGDILQRTLLFVKGLLYQTRRYKIKSELILVEWNPPADKPLLKEMLPQPEVEDYLSIRYVVVPAKLHAKYQHADKIPLFQMIAKNVGIRRSRGRFILCTNVDLLFSDRLMQELAGDRLQAGVFYRCNRADVPQSIPYDQTIPELLAYCSQHILQRLGKHIYISRASEWAYAVLIYTVGLVLPWWREPGLGQQRTARQIKMKLIQLDTDACGDFTLMSREDWIDIEGYVELEAYSIHLDSLALLVASALGKKQHTFKPSACTYHVSHEDGWELADPIRKLYRDIERPMLDWSTVRRTGIYLLENQHTLGVNSPNWGLADHELKEFIFNPPN